MSKAPCGRMPCIWARACLQSVKPSKTTQVIMAAFAEQLENQEIGRGDLSDAQWSKLKPLLPPQKPKTGRPKSRFRYFLGDKAYSSQNIRTKLRAKGVTPVIPRKSNETNKERFNRGLYRERNRVERLINRLKQNRRIATRYEKYLDSDERSQLQSFCHWDSPMI